MKKLYTLLLVAAAAVSANAANFVLTVDGKTVNDGDRIDLSGDYKDGALGWGYYPHVLMTPSVSGEAEAFIDFYKDDTTPKLDDEWAYGCSMSVSCCAFGACQMWDPGVAGAKTGAVTAGETYDYELEMIMNLGDYEKPENIKVDSEFSVKTSLEGESMTVVFYVNQQAGIDGVSMDSEAPAVYYDLQGRQVQQPSNGIYIKRQGSRVSKVAL